MQRRLDSGGRPREPLSAPLREYAPEPNLLERRARSYLDARVRTAGEPPLSDRDRSALTRIRNRTVMWAAISGTCSGLVIGGLEVYLRLGVLGGGDERGMSEDPWIWIGFYLFVCVLTVIEIAFLYRVALKGISRTREVIGIAIDAREVGDLVHTGLARGALEIPNPHKAIYGVDPYALVPRWRLLAWNLLYKTKVGITGFILRILMRRVLARAVLRSYLPLLAVPLYAGWNAFIIWRVMAEARLRALGPFGVRQIMALAARDEVRAAWRRAVLHGCAEMIRCGGDAHPNYVLLLAGLADQFDMREDDIEPGWPHDREEIGGLTPEDRRALMHILTAVAVLAGRPHRAQIGLLAEIHDIAGVPFDKDRPAGFRRQLLDGRNFAA